MVSERLAELTIQRNEVAKRVVGIEAARVRQHPECCTREPQAEVGATNLYRAYQAWCERAGEKARAQAEFGEEMARHSLPSERRTAGPDKGRKRYRGLALDVEGGGEE